ncbi:MAG: class I SAM-dependent methyltransferase, partial [Candidatus Dormibacteria bacterium]
VMRLCRLLNEPAHGCAGSFSSRHRRMTHALCDASWLELHFEACRAEYELLLDHAGLQRGWRVLDAGCGVGTYLESLSTRVAPDGVVVGCDLDATNAAAAHARRTPRGSRYDRVDCASVLALPYADRSFEAVWCANVLQYLDDADVRTAIAQFRRVVRSGGLIALKDVDMLQWHVEPGDPGLIVRLLEATRRLSDVAEEANGAVRGAALESFLTAAGLERVQQRTVLIERSAPIDATTRAMYASWLQSLGGMAAARHVGANDLATWALLAQPDHPEHPLNSATFRAGETQVVATAIVP